MPRNLIVVVALAVVVAVMLLSRPLYRRYCAERSVRNAREALVRSDYAAACLNARKALQLDSRNLAAWALLADIAQECGAPQVLPIRQYLAEVEPDHEEHRLGVASIAAQTGHPRLAHSVRRWLDRWQLDSAQMLHAAANLALVARDTAGAEAHLRRALGMSPSDLVAQFNLAVLQLSSADPGARSRGRTALNCFRENPALEPEALRSLINDAILRHSIDEAFAMSAELAALGRAEFADQMIRLELSYWKSQSARARSPCPESGVRDCSLLLSQLQHWVRHDPERIYELGAWMVQRGMASEARAWIDLLPGRSGRDTRVAMLRAECMAAAGRWSELDPYLRDQRWADLEFQRYALLALTARKLSYGPTTPLLIGSSDVWPRAVRAADGNLNKLRLLAKRAASWNWSAETEAVLWRIVDQFPAHDWASQMLLQAYYLDGATARIMDLSAAMLKRRPQHWVAKNNLALTSLLLNTNVDMAHALAREVFWNRRDASAAVSGQASTYAYSLHCQGRTAEALDVLNALPATQLRTPATAAYYAAFLTALGRRAEASPYLEIAERGPLLPEECDMIENKR